MLSKEEIEFNLKALSGVMLNFEDRLCDEMQERVKEVKEYIDQLESDKQKLIEKLEERKKEYKEKSGGNTYHIQSMINAEIRELDWVLSILKGENHE